MSNQTYYQILGVSQTATDDEIKRAYRKMARQYHPDVNKSSDAESKMKAINSAYDILSDPQKRADYDRFGNQYSQQGYQQNYQQPYQGQQYSQNFESMDDLFAYIFAQQFRQQQSRQQYQQQYYQQYRRPVQTSFFSKVISFFWMFIMIRFLLWLFIPF